MVNRHVLNLDPPTTPDSAGSEADAMSAGFEFISYMNDGIERKRGAPGDDLLLALIHLEDGGDTVDHSELLSMVQLLLIAGHETTLNLIGHGMVELIPHPDERRLGAPLARLEATSGSGAILDRWPQIDFAGDPHELECSPGFFLGGLRRLLVRI